jgi:hypothetical protein
MRQPHFGVIKNLFDSLFVSIEGSFAIDATNFFIIALSSFNSS